MKKISRMKIPALISSSKRLLSSKQFEPCITTNKSSFSVNKVRNIYTCGKLYSNSFSHIQLVKKSQEDDDKPISNEFPDTPYYFKKECNKQINFLSGQLRNKNDRLNDIINEDWTELRDLVLKMPGTVNEMNIDAIIVDMCAEMGFLTLGKLYFKYLKSSSKVINRATYGNYLRLFFLCKCDCTSDDLNEISVIYKELMKVYPLLDSHTAEKVVCALSITENWKEYEKLFAAIKQMYNPSTFAYKAVILAAFDHQEFEKGWKLIEEMAYLGLLVPDDVFLYWFQIAKRRKLEEDLTRVLNFFNYFNKKPSDEICHNIEKIFKTYNAEGKVSFTRVAGSGECLSCHTTLEPCHVSQEDFDELKIAFLNPVLVGKDIFQKTKPEEFEKFKNILKDSAPFDIVLDGLNIALHGSGKSIKDVTSRLSTVVRHFATLNKRVFVLGRKHMASWDSPNMQYVYRNAEVFLTDNLSQDDPFMLYSALYSGLGTCFVSRDMMRSHKFLLTNPKLQITFQKWQSTHQYFINTIAPNGRVYFQEPVTFLQTVQQNSKGDWHVPYFIRGEELTNRDKVDHLHRHWLCLQKKSLTRGVTYKTNRPRERSISPGKALETQRPIKKPQRRINLDNLFKDDP